ncbi:MAG: XRE family transcriptional regulator, partial [Clostridiales bacterium]|nr:XRE family transcriptional regulator [Clostridiales bacterium]
LSVIVLKMLDSLNQVAKEKDRLVEIAVDGRIDDEEIRDFVSIQEKLDRISVTVDTLRLWADKMLAEGSINMEVYNTYRSK